MLGCHKEAQRAVNDLGSKHFGHAVEVHGSVLMVMQVCREYTRVAFQRLLTGSGQSANMRRQPDVIKELLPAAYTSLGP